MRNQCHDQASNIGGIDSADNPDNPFNSTFDPVRNFAAGDLLQLGSGLAAHHNLGPDFTSAFLEPEGFDHGFAQSSVIGTGAASDVSNGSKPGVDSLRQCAPVVPV